MKPYLDLLDRILKEGVQKGDRTGTGTISVFGNQMRFNLQEGFPLLTTKKLHLKSIIYELLWFLQGNTNAKWLQDRGVRIWNEWADEDGNLGHIYGYQWRSWPDYNGGHIDQISDVADGKLSCQLYQRSADTFLGVPFNIASYALLTMMVAQVCDLQPGDFVYTTGDTHLYLDHIEQAKLQLTREPRPLPKMKINPNVKSIFDFQYEDFELTDYDPHPHIKATVSV